MELSLEQTNELYAALLSAFPDIDSLERLVYLGLGENLDSIAAGQSLPGRVLNLIRWAKAQGRVALLIEKAHSVNPGNPQLKRFAAQVLGRVGCIAPAYVDALSTILSDVDLPETLLHRIYCYCLPESAERRRYESLALMLKHLSDLPLPSSDDPPLVKFVRQLIRRLPSRRAAMERWIAEVEADRGWSLPIDDHTSPKMRYFVAVAIGADEDAEGHRLASIQTWKENASEPDREHEWLSSGGVSLDEIQLNLRRQLASLADRIPPGEDSTDTEIVVEFCLPRLLLVEPVDRWEIPDSLGGTKPIGAEYPVIVRDVQRLPRQSPTTFSAKQRWAACWTRIHTQPVSVQESIVWLSDSNERPKDVWTRLLPSQPDKIEVVCIGFPFVLEMEYLRQEEGHCLCGPWHAGIPIALWPQQKGIQQSEIEYLLHGHLISELPDRIFELRKQAYLKSGRTEDHAACDLTLVWDDPRQIHYADHMRGQAGIGQA